MKLLDLPGVCCRSSLRHLTAMVVAGAAIALLPACGDDAVVDEGFATIGDGASLGDGSAISGDDATTGSDASGTIDVSIIGGDASAGGTDATIGTDVVTDPTKTCAGKCGQYDAKAACQCDSKCTGAGDCCADYQSLCGTTSTGCGDGKCTPPENQQTCPADCGTVTSPGSCVGKCGQYNKNWSCQCDDKCTANGDCCGDLATACPVTGPSCGDGTCNNGETNATCPKDCPATGGGGGGPIASCVETACPAEVATCQGDANCAKVLTCAEACSDQNCLFGCVQQGGGGFQLPNGLTGLYQCGQQAGCFNGAGGGGGGPTATCGDGTCNGTETNATCPKDCPAGGGGGGGTTTTPDQCLAASCAKNYTDCQANATCKAALPCVESGKQVYNCMSSFDFQAGQILFQVQQCGNQNKCF